MSSLKDTKLCISVLIGMVDGLLLPCPGVLLCLTTVKDVIISCSSDVFLTSGKFTFA